MLRWGLTFLCVVLVIALVYFRALAKVEELAPLVPVAPTEDAARIDPEPVTDAARAPVDSALAARAPLEARPGSARVAALRGRVLTPTGEPCGGATLRFATVRRGRAELEQTKSGPDGRFELVPAASAARGDLLATADAHEFAPAVRRDVAAGPEELELVLAPGQTFAVRFVDAQGVALEPHQLSFHWMLAGVTREDDEDALGKQRWIRSPVPFRIHVNDPALVNDWCGPFEPSTIGDVLVVDVRRRALVRGIVRAGGAPVAGAEVRLESVAAPASEPGRVLTRTQTDARGEFLWRLTAAETSGPLAFRPVAFHALHGRGLGPELVCDGQRDLDGLEIELNEPLGRIEGRILLPPERDAGELVVQLGSRARTPREDGSFLLPEVEPGLQTVGVAPGTPEWPRDAWQWLSSEPVHWLGHKPTWNVEVRSGATSELTLDLATPAPVRIEGRIELGKAIMDASTLGNFAARGVTFQRDGVPGVEGQAFLDAAGRFAAGFAKPGARRFELQIMLSHRGDGTGDPQLNPSLFVTSTWTVRDSLELVPGLNDWDLVLAPGALRLRAPGAELELSPGPDLHWQGPGECTVDVQGWAALYDSSQEALTYAEVPPGRVTFQLVPDGTTYEAVVRSGETTEFLLPESARPELEAAYDVRANGLQLPSYLMDMGGY